MATYDLSFSEVKTLKKHPYSPSFSRNMTSRSGKMGNRSPLKARISPSQKQGTLRRSGRSPRRFLRCFTQKVSQGVTQVLPELHLDLRSYQIIPVKETHPRIRIGYLVQILIHYSLIPKVDNFIEEDVPRGGKDSAEQDPFILFLEIIAENPIKERGNTRSCRIISP